MADFNKAMAYILPIEGGFVNDPSDPGGATKYGISLRFLKSVGEFEGFNGDKDKDGDIDVDDILLLSTSDASLIYKKEFWNLFRYDQINDDNIANKVMDFSINIGPHHAHKIIQRALNLLPPKPGTTKEYLQVDGNLGPRTMAAINNARPDRLMLTIQAVLAVYYVNITESNHVFEKYICGWISKKVLGNH